MYAVTGPGGHTITCSPIKGLQKNVEIIIFFIYFYVKFKKLNKYLHFKSLMFK